MSNSKIELKPAYMWDCDNCGRENFTRGLVPELSQEELHELQEEYGIEQYDIGDFVMMPLSVTCKFCNCCFNTQHFREDI